MKPSNNSSNYLPDKLLTPKEVAARLSISLSKVYQLLMDGSIPVVGIGKSRRVDPLDLVEFIARRKSHVNTGQSFGKGREGL